MGFTEVCIWLKYYLWIGHYTYELLINFIRSVYKLWESDIALVVTKGKFDFSSTRVWFRSLSGLFTDMPYHYTSDSLWKIWLVESIQSIHNSLWTCHDKCNICCRYCIYHVKFNVCLVTKTLGVFSSETKWLNASLLFLRMNYVKNV